MTNIDFDIYVLIDPRDKRVKYVGQSWDANARFRSHLSYGKHRSTRPLHKWFKELRLLGLLPVLEVIAGAADESEVGRVERYWISWFKKRGPLFNAKYPKLVT